MRVKIKKPKLYDGTRNAKMLGNFYWNLEQYLDQMSWCSDEAKVNAISMYLTWIVMWWRTRVDDLASGRITERNSTWAEMKATLYAKFGRGNQAWIARIYLWTKAY